MQLVFILIGVGIFILVLTFFETKKRTENIRQTVKLKKCSEYCHYKKPMIVLALMIIPCLISAGIGYVNNNETMTGLGVLLSFLFLSEVYRAYFVLRIYYNDQGVIVDQKFIRYKSIKTLFKNSSLPFSKWTLITFSSERISVDGATAKFIEENRQDSDH